MKPTTTEMARPHERRLARAFDGRRCQGSGNQFTDQMDVRNEADQRFPFAVDGKSTFARSISVTTIMWAKAVEQAHGLRPALGLRFYRADHTLSVLRDLVVLDLNDVAEMLGELRELRTK